MLALRRVWTVLAGALAGVVIARAVLEWLLGLDGSWVEVAVLASAVVGGAVNMREARALRPMPARERRDAILGWGALVGAVTAIVCLYLPLPWGVIAAAGVLALTVLGLRRAAPAEPDTGRAPLARARPGARDRRRGRRRRRARAPRSLGAGFAPARASTYSAA